MERGISDNVSIEVALNDSFGSPSCDLPDKIRELPEHDEKIEKLLPALVWKALKLVTETQRSYWRRKNPIFFSLCGNGELVWTLKRIEHDSGLTET